MITCRCSLGLAIVLAGAMACCGLVSAAEPAGGPQVVLIIGWDGAQRDHVKECLARKELPVLQRLADEGAMVNIDIEGTTDTKAGWSQILTGYYPEITGVFSNGRYQPIPEGYSVPERLERHFGDDNIFTFATIGKSGHVDADPPKKTPYDEAAEKARAERLAAAGKKAPKPEGTIVEEDGVKYRVVPGKPHLNMSRNIDFFRNGLMLDEKVGTLAIELIEQHKGERMFGFIHFATVDHMGHKHGENSKEYNDALISNDTWTGKIIEKLKELGLYGKSLIYVCADHGFDEGKTGHANAPYTVLATNDRGVMRDGLRQDIAPTVLVRFGLDLGQIEPKLDGVPLTQPCQRGEVVLGAASPHSGRAAAKTPKQPKQPKQPGQPKQPRQGRKKQPAGAAP
mgnify:FL=1